MHFKHSRLIEIVCSQLNLLQDPWHTVTNGGDTGGAVFKKPEIITVPWKDGEKAVKMRWGYHEKCHVKYGEKRWKTIVTVRHCGDGNGDGNHDGDGDGESSVTVGVNYGENGEVRVTVTVTVKDGERRFHRTFTALSP